MELYSGVASHIQLGGHLTYNTCITILTSLLCTVSTQNWAGMCPSRPALSYATDGVVLITTGKLVPS